MIEIEVTKRTFCDVRGTELQDTGWALVRRYDGQEVAHFGVLSYVLEEDSARKLFDAAWAAAHTPFDEDTL